MTTVRTFLIFLEVAALHFLSKQAQARTQPGFCAYTYRIRRKRAILYLNFLREFKIDNEND